MPRIAASLLCFRSDGFDAANFEVLDTDATLVIHNSTSGVNPACAVVPVLPSTWGSIKTIYR